MTADELRQAFLNFFRDRGHKVIPGSSLVPHKDPSLLFTSAGMVQIKPYYLGLETPPCPRLASCQKCFRTSDIDSVGDTRHLTFFEMLGNFSVGDYFKKETISWAWEFVTEHLRLPEERLWITIYLDDEDAYACWRELGIAADRIVRFGAEDNFWGPVGDSGPCGPCSEIHYDFGAEVGCGRAGCKPNCSCGRFSEIWNLVFTQYNQEPDGRRNPLPRPNIDTGMGLERTLAAIQGRSSPYETHLFLPLVERICRLSGKQYGQAESADRAIRIVAEHTRGIAFLIADGVMPSNEGRGYVLRRILRRASLFGRELGMTAPFLHEMADVVVGTMGHVYPELAANHSLTAEVVRAEEEKFGATLDTGLALAKRFISEALAQGNTVLTGEEVFRLYDTYGFAPELTAEMAKNQGLSVDWEDFRAKMEKQRERARAGQTVVYLAGHSDGQGEAKGKITAKGKQTRFVGYRQYRCESKIWGLATDRGPVHSADKGSEVDMILDKTPFYAEMGGQVGDRGEIRGRAGKVLVTNTFKDASNAIVHRGKVIEGSVSVGDVVEAEVDVIRRADVARNHTATHLLQAALRETLGSRVYQKGSLVEADRLRFDFSHTTPVSEEELRRIQAQVNEWIRQDLKVKARLLPYPEAIAEGAIALFEEKYGERVRMLEIGEPAISKELCGGTHMRSTGEIGMFLITSQSNVGTGLHRIEAVTGRKAESTVESRLATLQLIAKEVSGSPDEVLDRVKAVVSQLEDERKRALSLERELARRMAEDLERQAERVGNVSLLTAKVPALTMPILREMGDMLKDRLKSAVIILATVHDGKPGFLAMVTPDLIAKGFDASRIISQVARVTGGGGGGKASMAQAGGKDAAKIDEALRLARSIVAGENPSGQEGQK